MNDLEYRRKQLQQLQDNVVNLEDMTGGVSITDLTLNDFRMDLSSFMKEHMGALEIRPHRALCRYLRLINLCVIQILSQV
jgi:hypothetical protein